MIWLSGDNSWDRSLCLHPGSGSSPHPFALLHPPRDEHHSCTVSLKTPVPEQSNPAEVWLSHSLGQLSGGFCDLQVLHSCEWPSLGKRPTATPAKLWWEGSGSHIKTQGIPTTKSNPQLESKCIVHKVKQPVYSLFTFSQTVELPFACKWYLSPYKLITFRLFLC